MIELLEWIQHFFMTMVMNEIKLYHLAIEVVKEVCVNRG